MTIPSPLRLFVLPLCLLSVSCGETEEEAGESVQKEESTRLRRELSLALEVDTTLPPELGDVAVTPLPAPGGSEALPESAGFPAPPPRSAGDPRAAPAPPTDTRPWIPEAPLLQAAQLESGTSLSLRLDQELSTEHSAVGTSFQTSLVQAVRDGAGGVLLPAGAVVKGEVIESKAALGVGEEPRLAVEFHTLLLAGERYPLVAAVESLPVRRVSRDSPREQAAKVGGAAAAGAIVGRVMGGDRRSAMRGAVVGAVTGGAVVAATRRVDLVLPEGALLRLRLTRPLRLTR